VPQGPNTIEVPVGRRLGRGRLRRRDRLHAPAAGRRPPRACRDGPSASPGSASMRERAPSRDARGPEQIRAAHGAAGARAPRGPPAGETARVTVAAVDLGILTITNYQPPKPDAFYLGQRRLGAEVRDLYGLLIDGMSAVRGSHPLRRRRRGRPLQGTPPAQAAAVAVLRHPRGRPRRHGGRRVRHPGLQRHRAPHGHGLDAEASTARPPAT
jgi:hypothetical protein